MAKSMKRCNVSSKGTFPSAKDWSHHACHKMSFTSINETPRTNITEEIVINSSSLRRHNPPSCVGCLEASSFAPNHSPIPHLRNRETTGIVRVRQLNNRFYSAARAVSRSLRRQSARTGAARCADIKFGELRGVHNVALTRHQGEMDGWYALQL